MPEEILINFTSRETRVAVLENDRTNGVPACLGYCAGQFCRR